MACTETSSHQPSGFETASAAGAAWDEPLSFAATEPPVEGEEEEN